MTKGELLKLLEPFSDDQYVYVNLHSKNDPNGSQVMIQGVKEVPPWHEGPPNLIGLLADIRNAELKPQRPPTQGGTGVYRPERVK